jgi:uncharacterized protein
MNNKWTRVDRTRFGPWAVVTGASSGIGRAFARQLAANGLNVVLAARRGQLLEELGQELLKEFGVEYRAIPLDVTSEDFLRLIRTVTDGLDVGLLISNAGAPLPGEFLQMPMETLLRQVRLDVTAPLQLTHHFARRLAERGRGGVVLVSAMGAGHGLPLASVSAAGKSFVLSLGEGLHVEFAKRGLNLSVLIVGPTDTQVIDMMGLDRSKMPIKPQSAGATAAEALAALVANRPTHLSGRINRILFRVMPTPVSTRLSRSMVEQGVAALAARAKP